MGTNIGGSNEVIYLEMVEDEVKGTQKVPVGQKAKSFGREASVEIPAHIIDEAISTIRDIGFIWSSPITPKEIEYVEQYELAKYPEYANLIEGAGSGIDMSSFITDEPSEITQTSVCLNER
ncbi:hypothetical protein L195_g022813 [Trifolium pratense]|uniref:Uncharacterized protein n=1 Tax=Trifolium pratense TaxID=57577 RepID=A0A2K3N922_TRIPR|nr:hypothetical protein L195_g022813 [Trifolium pratense]